MQQQQQQQQAAFNPGAQQGMVVMPTQQVNSPHYALKHFSYNCLLVKDSYSCDAYGGK